MSDTSFPTAPAPRRVSILLIVGIVLMPWAFAWFTLRRGHSTMSRVLSLGWAALFFFAYINGGGTPAVARAPRTQAAQTEEAAPNKKTKRGVTRENYDAIQVGWTRQQVIDLLGKPHSASEVQGVGVGKDELLMFRTFALVGIKAPKVVTINLTNDRVAMKNWSE